MEIKSLPDKLSTKIDSVGNDVLLDETLAAVKNRLSELRPRVLDAFGLGAAIEWLCSDFQRRTGIACGCSACEIDPPLSTEKSTALFRIVQESLTNVAKHSKATKVKVVIEHSGGDVAISIKDNGIAITAENLTAFHSFGILGMKERAEMLGGTFSITRPLEGGTLVVVQLPENAKNA